MEISKDLGAEEKGTKRKRKKNRKERERKDD
jgi:hypothetical protein